VTIPERTLIVIPAFNESASIASVVAEVRDAVPGATILVVDDGSADATTEVARRAGARVARLPYNLGVGGAMRVGFRYAVDHDFRQVVQVDADGQHDPRHVPALLDGLVGADIVIGARFAGAGSYRATGPRRWAMRLLSAVLSRAAGTRLDDTTSGFKACGPKAIALFADQMPAEYLGDTVEALVIALRHACRVVQLPVEMRQRMAGQPSHGPVKSAVYLGRALIALFFAYARPVVAVRSGGNSA
jgi:Glycosyltransferases involved in cell wall biogenesis